MVEYSELFKSINEREDQYSHAVVKLAINKEADEARLIKGCIIFQPEAGEDKVVDFDLEYDTLILICRVLTVDETKEFIKQIVEGNTPDNFNFILCVRFKPTTMIV